MLARIDRLPPSRYLTRLVARIATGGWFEFYELFMPGFISLGLVKAGIYSLSPGSIFDVHLFASFLASFFLGMFISAVAFSFISDLLGRRSIFVQSMMVYSIAQLSIVFLSNPTLIDVARFIAGVAVGMQLINHDSDITELTPRATRGRYMTAAYVFVLSAIPVAAFLAAALIPHAPFGIDGWRIVVAIGATGGVLVLWIQRGLPESPRWLESKGRVAEAEAVVSEIETRITAEPGRELPEPGTIIISVFQFSQTIAVFGFTSFVPVLLVKQGFTIIHSLYYTAMTVLLAPVGAACASYCSERIERKWQQVGSAVMIAAAGTMFANAHTVLLV